MTGLLIRATLNHSKTRLGIKMVTCALFVWLALIPAAKGRLNPSDVWILGGLGLSFMGDLALGLKTRGSVFMVVGLGFFTLAQFAYLRGFPIQVGGLWIWLGLCLFQTWILKRLYSRRPVELPRPIRLPVMLYDCLLVGVLALAVTAVLNDPSLKNWVRFGAGLTFTLSDTLLFGVYFAKPAKASETVAYLSLYHLAQILYALSLWV